MSDPTQNAGIVGVTFASMIIGFIGAVLGISYVPEMSKKQMFAALLAGLCCAAFMTPVAAHWYSLYFGPTVPQFLENGIAFLLGISGMYIVPGFLSLSRSFRDNPFGFLDRLRGRASVPDVPPKPPGDQP